MIGKIKLLSKENQVLKIYTYEELMMNRDLKNTLREKLLNGNKLYCCCNNNLIEMKMVLNTIYVVQGLVNTPPLVEVGECSHE